MDIIFQASAKITYKHIIERTEQLTFPNIRKKVLSMPIREPYSGVWAIKDQKILGMILADHTTNGVSELFSFYVLPEERNKGLGKQLLIALETLLKKQGVKYVRSSFNSNWKSLKTIQKLIASNKWGKPVLIKIIAEGNIEKYRIAPWPVIKMPSDYSFFQWENLSNDDKKEMDLFIKQKEIPHEFNPYQHEEKIYLPASIGLRYKEKIIGWNIVYMLKEDTLEYNNLFLLKDYRKAGHAITLLHKSFGRQYEEGDVPKSTWVINYDSEAMMKIFQRIAAKHVYKYIEVKLTGKKLN